MRRKLLVPLVAAAAITVVVAIAGCGSDEPSGAARPAPDAAEALRGAPPELAALHGQANRFLDGGADAFEKRLAELRGRPVVVNKWASWCGPCRAEFPAFQRVSAERGKEVAFLGLNSNDERTPARDFLRRFPLPFPSYEDPRARAAQELGIAATFPMTVFFDARGEQTFIHQGPYLDAEDLDADVDRYALGKT